MPVNKIVNSFEEAVADIHDGSVVILGGFGSANGTPSNLIRALASQGAQGLTLKLGTFSGGRSI